MVMKYQDVHIVDGQQKDMLVCHEIVYWKCSSTAGAAGSNRDRTLTVRVDSGPLRGVKRDR